MIDREAFWKKEIADAEVAYKQAKANYDEYAKKLSAIDAELSRLKTEAIETATSMKAKVVDQARHLAQTVVRDSKEASTAAVREAAVEIRREVVGQIIQRAETMIQSRLTPDEKARITIDFSRQVAN